MKDLACNRTGCLGHPDQRSVEVICSRCKGTRWTLVRPSSADVPAGWSCRRCTVALAGGIVADPVASPARVEALRKARASQSYSLGRAQKTPRHGRPAGSTPGA